MEPRPVAEIIAYVFLDLAVIMVIARLMGRLAVRVGQPAVVGEIVAGILLGPTLLGALPGDLDTLLFPPDIRPFLNVLAQLGLVLFMFLIGLEVDLSFIRGRERVAVSVSLASILLPFALGVLLATYLHTRHDVFTAEDGDTSAIPFLGFALFLGVAMSITAFPVLARILAERQMHRIPTGVLALACAAVDDVLAWCLLAVVVAIVAATSFTGVVLILGLSTVFALVMFLVVKPLLRVLVARYERLGRLTPEMLAGVLVGILASAWVAEEIGIHFIFGAFLFGVVMPRKGAARLNHEIIDRLEQVSVLLLLPVFFVVTGLNVDVGAIDLAGVGELALILLVAISGKFVGAFAAARVQRVPRRQATALATLMNTRGLTELVILTIGVQQGVLDGEMFTLMVIMAVVTTVMASPLLNVIYPKRVLERDIAAAERAEMGLTDAYTVVVVVDDLDRDAGLVDLACDLVGRERPAQVVLTRVVRRSRPKPEVSSGLGADLELMATVAGELRTLARRVEERGLRASVASRFSEDPWAEVTDLAGSSTADVVLVRSGWGIAEGALTAATGHPWPPSLHGSVVVVSGELGEAGLQPGGPVAVVQDTDADGRAALRVAAHAAVGRSAPLQLRTGGRRGVRRTVADSLRRAGVQVAADTEALPALLVAPAGAAPLPAADDLTPILLVHAGTADADRDMDETLAALAAVAGPETPRAESV
ncbi:Kef-type K+ transport system, membrane component KefB [Geodermatophilus telluris]|uniref:Kef-type K+ transport system, membrane component KefB n=1 Tax=Geodermatophilus telluris TaxID=1190417 RepID=A0A1G6QP98_9ACTN|nr:cation:proton antiporter [Geodermatophilus telluris]SDC94071.1 Kef-type K+ transport system, membrane component KefB [Geodermatophilus telluris]